ncbi:MAG: class B sortase [Gemmiger sp.]
MAKIKRTDAPEQNPGCAPRSAANPPAQQAAAPTAVLSEQEAATASLHRTQRISRAQVNRGAANHAQGNAAASDGAGQTAQLHSDADRARIMDAVMRAAENEAADAARAAAQEQQEGKSARHAAEPEGTAGKKGRKNGNKAKSDRIYNLLIAAFSVVFLVSAGMLGYRFWQDKQSEDAFSDVAALIATPAPGDPQPEDNSEKYAGLKAKNEDFAGWLKIEGTNLNYPVMYHPGSVDYYLRRDFYGEYSNYGTPYIDEKCTLDPMSNNIIIYGHNMKTGTIFGCLTEYKKAAYYQEHPTIQFDTLAADGTYEVYAAFAIDVVTDTSFLYNTYTDMDETSFNEFVSECKRRSDVESGITPVYGDQLLTLSTCEYSTDNGRYVVCARRVE